MLSAGIVVERWLVKARVDLFAADEIAIVQVEFSVGSVQFSVERMLRLLLMQLEIENLCISLEVFICCEDRQCAASGHGTDQHVHR